MSNAQFIERIATLLGISSGRIIVTELVAGNVIVSFEIAELNSASVDEFSATTALEMLKSEVAQGTDAFDLFGVSACGRTIRSQWWSHFRMVYSRRRSSRL